MGKALLDKMVPVLEKMEWPQMPQTTEKGRLTFVAALEKLDGYDGDPKVISGALRTLQTGDSRPYACAGVAYALLVAAREADGSYDAGGLELTMEWLERAQEVEPDVLEINVIEGLVYVYNGRLEDARLVLDYLEEQGARNHFLHRAEVAYWMQMGDVAQTIHWFNRAAESAENVPQRLGMKAQLGDYYFRQNMLDEALVVYQEAVHFDKNNPALWYKIAIIHWRGEVLEEAEISNNQALRVQPDYAPAVKLAEAIKKKKSESGRLGRLFGS